MQPDALALAVVQDRVGSQSAWRDGRELRGCRSLIASVEVLLGLAERAIPLVAIPFRAT